MNYRSTKQAPFQYNGRLVDHLFPEPEKWQDSPLPVSNSPPTDGPNPNSHSNRQPAAVSALPVKDLELDYYPQQYLHELHR